MAKASFRNRIVGQGTEAPDQLLANPRNWRIHPKNQQDALEGELEAVGWVQQVIVNQRTGFVIDGHLRVALAISREEPLVPVLYVDLSEAEEARVLAALDPLAGMAVMDPAKLAELLADVSVSNDLFEDLARQAGVKQAAAEDDPGAEIDRAEELRAKWGTERGQLWLIGNHRLLCGDSTNAADVARLMNGERAAVALTDPPYNVGKDYGESTNDSHAAADYALWTRSWVGVARGVVDCIVVTVGMVNIAMWYIEVGAPTWVCSWRKSNQQSPSGLRGWNGWEPLMVYGSPAKPVGQDAWDIPVALSKALDGLHIVPKTLAAWATFLEAFTDHRALTYDPFLGSGTTMVAAEQLGRRCFAMEIEPKYVAVCLERMAGMGLEPVRGQD